MKAIKMDIVQIGKHCNALSHETQNKIQKFDLKGIINLRNFITHGYTMIEKDTIWKSIYEDLQRLIEQLNNLLTA